MNKQDIKYYFDFLWAMTEKEIKARYKGTFFGFFWVALSPILQMLVIGLIFSFFIAIPNYFLFLLAGILPWSFFLRSVSMATSSIVSERALLQKAKFPIEAIPISIILANFFHLIITFSILSIYLIITKTLIFPEVLLIVPALIWIGIFTTGFSLLSATLQVRYRDTTFLVHSLSTLWFYATPILYSLALIPEKARVLFALNPLTSIFELFHQAILNQGMINGQILLTNGIISVGVVILGVITYRRQYKNFIDLI